MNWRGPKALDSLVLAIVTTLLFANLGAYPAWFDNHVGFSLFRQVNHVLDGAPLDEVGWLWSDAYQHNAGLSPVYSGLTVAGFRAFGLSLVAPRLPLVLLAILALVLQHVALRLWVRQRTACLFTILSGSCSWYLLFARSGGILGMSLSLVGIALSLLAITASRTRGDSNGAAKIDWLLGLSCGALVGLLPYGHVTTRLLALLLALGVPFASRLFSRPHRITFVLGVVVFLIPQFRDPGYARMVYFNARGEGVFTKAAEQPNPTPASTATFIVTKVWRNVQVIARAYSGTAGDHYDFLANEAHSYWVEEIVLYPRYLVPFFLFGLGLVVRNVLRDPASGYSLFLAFGFVTLLPSLLCGMGSPNAARLLLHLPAIYGCIVLGLEASADLASRFVRHSFPRWLLGTAVVAGVVTLQAYNFFGYEKGAMDDKNRSRELVRLARVYRSAHPEALLILQEYPEFNLQSYVMPRLLGGKWLEAELAAGNVLLLKDHKTDFLKQQLEGARPCIVLTEAPEAFLEVAKDLPFSRVERVSNVTVFTSPSLSFLAFSFADPSRSTSPHTIPPDPPQRPCRSEA